MAYNPGGGSGSVTSVSVVTANGVSASVANASSTPALTFTLGAITPSTVNGVTISGSGTAALRRDPRVAMIDSLVSAGEHVVFGGTGAFTFTLPASPADGDEVSAENLGDTDGTIARNGKEIDGVNANLVLPVGRCVHLIYDATSSSWYSVSTYQTSITGNAATSSLCTGNAATATALQTPRAINGTNFDGTAPITVTANPNAHASTHENGGADAMKVGTLRTTTTDITVAASYSVVVSCCYEVGSGFVTELSTDATLEVL